MTNKHKSTFYSDIGFQIRQIRSLKGFSLEDIAQDLGISWQTMQRYETGKIDIPTERLVKIAHILQTPISTFLDVDIDPVTMANGQAALRVSREIIQIQSPDIQKQLYHLARAINQSMNDNGGKDDMDAAA